MVAAALIQRWYPYLGGWWTGGIMVLWLVGLVLIAWLVWRSTRRGGWPRRHPPEETVRRRYARGEIDRETYQRLLEEICGKRP